VSPRISIIIPNRNNAARLAQCLQAVQRECAGREDVEVIVVDNGSEDGSVGVADTYGFHTRIANSSASPYLARNCGLKIAQGEYIILLDSNCIPATGWLNNGVRKVKTGTHIASAAFHFDPLRVIEFVARFDAIYSIVRKPETGVITALPCTNLFIHREVFARVGLFDDRRRSLEDINWTQKAYVAGFKLGIAEQALVRYPSKGGFRFLKKMYRLGRGKKEQALIQGWYYSARYVWHCCRQFLPPAPKFFLTMYRLGREEGLFIPLPMVVVLCYLTKISRGLGMITSGVHPALFADRNTLE
jgi:glycosyltransferase AglE